MLSPTGKTLTKFTEMLSPTKALNQFSTPAKKRLMALAAGTPGKGGVSTPNRDGMVRVTFCVKHEKTIGGVMHVVGSSPALGCWATCRARKMEQVAGSENEWVMAMFVPEKIEFQYQYLLLAETEWGEPPMPPPESLWSSSINHKCIIGDALATPGRQIRLEDDTRMEEVGDVKTTLLEDVLMPSHRDGKEEKLQLKQCEIDRLLEEREQCQNELQKLKDIMADQENPKEYRSRKSYLPDAGPLYDSVKGLQTTMQRKILAIQALQNAPPAISEEEIAASLEAKQEAEAQMAEARQLLEDAELAKSDLAAQVEELKQEADEVRKLMQKQLSSGEAEKGELREYYQKTMGEMDVNQKRDVADRMAQEEVKTMLQSSIRLVAGELDETKKLCSAIRADFVSLKDAFVLPALSDMETSIVGALAGVTGKMAEAETRLKKEVTERKRLHNLVQELKGNIRVFCRVRPMSNKNLENGDAKAVSFPSDTEVLVDNGGKAQCFSYDAVFDPSIGQAQVFEETQPLIVSVLDGYNVCIFAYGQTGSGKTHTMQGYGEDRGVNTRALEELFALSAERAANHRYEIKVSLLEIYNETIRDLLDPKDVETGEDKKLDVKMAAEGGTNVPGIEMVDVGSMDDVARALSDGERHRTVGKTNCNEHSSRSHMILSVFVKCSNLATGVMTHGKLHLIDLAGSERISRSGAQGDRLKEAQNINKSLSALGDVFTAISKKQNHVPFRNSKLTFLLQPCLSGDGKALVLMALSPADTSAHESLCTLRFSSLISQCELGKATKHMATEGAGGDSSATGMKRPSTAGPSSGMSMLKKPKA
mmetsp:Transcript_67162/g.160536  ORF Transcript_67162/g.160536 Transcript_67162/m.160536 type:complete len:820 (+) Transcript_67162:147-2606(+)